MADSLLETLLRGDAAEVREALPTLLPWASSLPADDLAAMIDELMGVARLVGEGGDTRRVVRLLSEWRHTAELHADPERHQAWLQRPLGGPGPGPGRDA